MENAQLIKLYCLFLLSPPLTFPLFSFSSLFPYFFSQHFLVFGKCEDSDSLGISMEIQVINGRGSGCPQHLYRLR